MKTAPKRSAIAAAVALFALCATIGSHVSFAQPQAQAQAAGIVTEQRQVGAFSAIELSGPYHVVIDAQARQAVQVSGERKRLDDMEVVVRGDTLIVRPVSKISFSFGFQKHSETPTVTIGAAGLKSLRMSGSGDVELDQAGGERFTLVTTGPGDLRASGAVRQLVVESSGSGDLDLRRMKVGGADVSMHGPGDVKLQNVSDTLDAELHGSGELAASMTGKRLLLKMTGPGDARIDGSVDQISAQISGSGSLEGRRLSVGQSDIAVRGPGSAAVNLIGNGNGDKGTLLVDRSGSHRSAN
jgi:hypothetical protein